MNRLICLRGLPGSGKSTFAKQLVMEDPETIRINRDILREMLHFGQYSESYEAQVISAEYFLARHFLTLGYTVIIDDTNLKPSTLKMWQDLAKQEDTEVDITSIDTPIETCIERDAARPKPIDADRIREMANSLRGS